VVAQAVETMKKTTSGSHLDAREVVVAADGRNSWKNHLRLAFECKGGGGGRRSVESTKKNHLQLAFGCEGVYFSVPQVIRQTPHGLMESMDCHVDSMDL